jgi:hypothetical protein
VSCASRTDCTAVGNYYPIGGFQPLALAEHWNGISWSIQPVSYPAAPTGNLAGVSCSSPAACTAVGDSNGTPLVERWNGSSWTSQPAPNPSTLFGSVLTAVSCATPTDCTAVGSYNVVANQSGGETYTMLVIHWTGGSWSLQPTPARSNSSGDLLYGVSCTSPTACVAVGYDDGHPLTLLER